MTYALPDSSRRSPGTVLYFIIMMAALLLQGCSASKAASYHYAQTQIEHGDINFQKTIRIDEYLNAFPQDWLQVPEGQDVILRVDPFTHYQPKGVGNTLVQIAVKTRDATVSDMKKSIGICFVLDKSGSMEADGNMQLMTDAVVQAVMEMNDGDEVAVVVFDNNAGAYIPAQQIIADSRNAIVQKIKSLSAGGATNIQDGLVMGYKEMSKFTVAGPKRLLLITDGMSNVGITSPEELARKSGSEYVQGARISTIGLGYEVDEDLLRKIAEEGKGHYYFAENGTYLKSLLVRDLMSTLHPIAKDVRLTVAATRGFSLLYLYGAEGAEGIGDNGIAFYNTITMDIGELNVDDWRILVAEVEGSVLPGEYSPVLAELTYTVIESNASSVLDATASVSWQTDQPSTDASVNPDVALNSVLYGNAATLIKIGELATQKKYKSALEILDVQIENNIIIRNEDNAPSVDKELKRLSAVRDIVANASGQDQPKAWSDDYKLSDEKKSQLKGVVTEGAMASTELLPGIWSTVAQILLILVL